MKFLTNFCTNAHWNMAFDEFVLEGIRAQEPLFFLWQNAPAVIIGLNQSPYAEVNLPYLEQKGILLARRVTGGGAVYHDLGNLNYSIAGPLEQMENAFEWGANWQKEQMLNDGMECTIDEDIDVLFADYTNFDEDEYIRKQGLKPGDKVKVIIIKDGQ